MPETSRNETTQDAMSAESSIAAFIDETLFPKRDTHLSALSSKGRRMKTVARSVDANQKTITASITGEHKQIAGGELTLAQQLGAVASLQRQRSAVLVGQWRVQEKAALMDSAAFLSIMEHS